MSLIIMRGISGSGKSTRARILQEHYSNSIVVSRDDIRYALYQEYFGGAIDEVFVTHVEFYTITQGLICGKTVISDNTNLYPQGVQERCNLAAPMHQGVKVINVDTPLSIALHQNATRERVVPESVIHRQHAAFEQHSDEVARIVERHNELNDSMFL